MSFWGYKNVFDTILFAACIVLLFNNGVPAYSYKVVALLLTLRGAYEAFVEFIAKESDQETE